MAYPSTRLSELLRAVEGGHRLDTVEALAILPEVPASELATHATTSVGKRPKRSKHSARDSTPITL